MDQTTMPGSSSAGGGKGGETLDPTTLTARPPPEYPVDRIPGATAIASEVTPAMIETIREDYHIPQSVTLIAPEPQWRACSPPVGYGTLYIKYLEFGFRLPFHTFWEQIVAHYHIALG